MPSILDHHSQQTTKMLVIGPSGTGKTGLIASLVAMGYKVRVADVDNGVDLLLNLLTNDLYPYKRYMEEKKIDLRTGLIYKTITERFKIHPNENRPIPRSASGFGKVMKLLEKWEDGDDIRLGHIETWDTDCVLVIDTFGTLADMAFYNVQALNSRLGARREGFDYQRDINVAQQTLTDLLKMLYDPAIKCNIIINTHVTWIDESRGIAEAPKSGDNVLAEVKGFPSAIGRAMSPVMGKYFNNLLYVSMSGSGQSVKRVLNTVPTDGVAVKNAGHSSLRPNYPIDTGLAEVFAALRGEPSPRELINLFRPPKPLTPGGGLPQRQAAPINKVTPNVVVPSTTIPASK